MRSEKEIEKGIVPGIVLDKEDMLLGIADRIEEYQEGNRT